MEFVGIHYSIFMDDPIIHFKILLFFNSQSCKEIFLANVCSLVLSHDSHSQFFNIGSKCHKWYSIFIHLLLLYGNGHLKVFVIICRLWYGNLILTQIPDVSSELQYLFYVNKCPMSLQHDTQWLQEVYIQRCCHEFSCSVSCTATYPRSDCYPVI